MSSTNYWKSYRIKYDVHCSLENHFGKEIIIKNCLSEFHAKMKLGAYCEKKYGKEFDFIKFISVTEEYLGSLYDSIFGEHTDISDLINSYQNDKKYKDLYKDFLSKLRNKKT